MTCDRSDSDSLLSAEGIRLLSDSTRKLQLALRNTALVNLAKSICQMAKLQLDPWLKHTHTRKRTDRRFM
uniref:Uncharacterized protein n=1 Tax=Anguilla anguilla TaxID=7936 RepID=A0A0E9TXS8_ANGAN